MMAIKAIEIILLLLLLFFVFSQIIVPAISGLPLFPAFRGSEKIKEQGRKANQELFEEELKQNVNKLNEKAQKLRSKNQPKGE